MKGNRLTISSVQTLLIQTFSLPSTPSTFSSSTPSHQHLRAGFLQNSSSFCAMPTTLLLASSLPLISVLRRARARLQMTALLGSGARWPQRSSLWKPLLGNQQLHQSDRRDIKGWTVIKKSAYPAVSISIRCCSVVPVSSLRRNPEKMPFCSSNALPAARFTSIISG